MHMVAMARGWESKSVESQMEDGETGRELPRRRAIEDIERDQKRDSIELSRRSVQRELEATTSPLRKASLEHALRHLDDELRKLR